MKDLHDKMTRLRRAIGEASSAAGEAESSAHEADALAREIANALKGSSIPSEDTQAAADRLCDAAERLIGALSIDESREVWDVRRACEDYRLACRPVSIVSVKKGVAA